MLDGKDKSARERKRREKRNSHDLYIYSIGYAICGFIFHFHLCFLSKYIKYIYINKFNNNNNKVYFQITVFGIQNCSSLLPFFVRGDFPTT